MVQISPPPLRPARQARSRRTLEALLSAADALLRQKSFEDISIAELVARAGVTTGAFYGRFTGKHDLLPGLYEKYLRWLDEECERELAPTAWSGMSAAAASVHAAELICRSFEARPWLLRAMVVYARQAPDRIVDTPPVQQRLLAGLTDRLLAALPAAARPPREQAEFAIYGGITVARELTLFPQLPMARALRLDKQGLRERIASMLALGLQSQLPDTTNGPNA
jgi:AcrR family transcriptional regulator